MEGDGAQKDKCYIGIRREEGGNSSMLYEVKNYEYPVVEFRHNAASQPLVTR